MVLCLEKTPHFWPWTVTAEGLPAAGLCPAGPLCLRTQCQPFSDCQKTPSAGGLPLPAKWKLRAGAASPPSRLGAPEDKDHVCPIRLETP